MSALSLPDGAVWQINREIVFQFNQPIDFASVSSNTIRIRSTAGAPATGVFSLRDERTVVFQPSCPTHADLSDAGLQPGGVEYELRVQGRNGSANTVRSARGRPLALQQVRSFTTPRSTQASLAFLDTKSGPPEPVLRAPGSATRATSYLEVGGDPERRVYFELDAAGAGVPGEAGFQAPLNLYAEPSTRLAFVIAFDQPIDPSAQNLAETRLRLEYEDGAVWRALRTRTALEANCSETGSRVRLEPIGVLPGASAVRAVVLPGFQDLVGEPVPRARTVATAPTLPIAFTSLVPADALSDALEESFDFGASSARSFEDGDALFDSPPALWGEGRLSAGFSFAGTGGPEGDFDWVVHAGERFTLDTTRAEINGGPGGIPTTTEIVLGGVVDVRDLIIEAGAVVRVVGPRPLRVRATGEVRIDGELDVSGFAAKNVASIQTGNLTEVGGLGVGGGGSGGNANENTSGSSVRGGTGQGPFGQAGLGAQGGEMGVSAGNANTRRPGGGGGGRFARDRLGTSTPLSCSLVAGAGTDGHPLSQGADPFDGHRPARGGGPDRGPFVDASDANDFFGTRPVLEDGILVGLLRGELPRLWGGYGGGGGGNASQLFPNPNWNPSSDEKGGGGGGGGGGVHIQALGRIVFGPEGQLLANGARGGTGENIIGNPRIGATGGGGSGGHVILETAAVIDFTGNGTAAGGRLREAILACGPNEREDNPNGNGGAGGGGVIQLHVPDATLAPGTGAPADILVPAPALAAADVLDELTSPPAVVLIPSFGKRSRARSRWIPIAGAGLQPDGQRRAVRFLFQGTDPATGRIRSADERVLEPAPLLSEEDLADSSSARLLADGVTLELDAPALAPLRNGTTAGLSNDLYLRTPALFRECVLRLFVAEHPTLAQDFAIVAATYDEGLRAPGDEVLRLSVSAENGAPSAFNAGGAEGTTAFQVLPCFFRVVTDGLPGRLPSSAFVGLRFQAATENAAGLPDEGEPLTPWTTDIASFNALAPGALRFFRYEVEFDLDVDDRGITADTRPVALEFLKIPFVF